MIYIRNKLQYAIYNISEWCGYKIFKILKYDYLKIIIISLVLLLLVYFYSICISKI